MTSSLSIRDNGRAKQHKINVHYSNTLVNKGKVIFLYINCLPDISSPSNTHIPYQYILLLPCMHAHEIETMLEKILIQVKQTIATNSQQEAINCCSVLGIN